jgi:hypothetical protein
MIGRAVLIGRNSGTLKHCLRDVTLMQEALSAHGFECRRIPTSDSLGDVINAIAKVTDACCQQETLIIYFSGHAYGEDGLQLVLDEPIHLQANRLQGNILVDLLSGCVAQSKLLILDSCHAGQAVDKADNWSNQPRNHFRILTAADGRSRAREDDQLQAGVFTYHLYRALTDPTLRRPSPDGVLDAHGHLSAGSIDPWLREAVSGYKSVKGGQRQPEPQLYGSTAKDVFFAYALAPPHAASAVEASSAHDGAAADHWLLKTLDRIRPLQALQDLLNRDGAPRLAVVDAIYERDLPNYLADCAMLWPERDGRPLPSLDEYCSPTAHGFLLRDDITEPSDLYLALHATLIPNAQDPERPEQAVCAELRSHRHQVLCCMLEIARPSRRPLRLLRLADAFLLDLGRREPGLAVVLLTICQPAGSRRPWWWSMWSWWARRLLGRRVHWLGRLGPITGSEVGAWWNRWPKDLQADARLRHLHEEQTAFCARESRPLDYREVSEHLARVWPRPGTA